MKESNGHVDHDAECEKKCLNALKFYEEYLTEKPTYDYFYSILKYLGSARKKPEYKKLSGYLNIIVAYRDSGDGYRKKQLDIFESQMSLIFKDRIDYHIYIIEQESERNDYDKLKNIK